MSTSWVKDRKNIDPVGGFDKLEMISLCKWGSCYLAVDQDCQWVTSQQCQMAQVLLV